MESILGVGTVIFLVLANAFFVTSEFSLISARRTRIDQLALEVNRAALAARHWTNAVSDES
jgi:CBS domain containing-hemolysin-like protein